MTTYQHKRISNGWLIFGLLLGVAGLAIGTFADLPLDQMVYDPFKVWARILAACGPAPVFWGLGAAGLLTLDVLKDKKTMFLGWLFAFGTNLVGPVYMADSIAEELGYSWWICWIAGLLISILPALLYWVLMRKAERKDKIKCIWILLIVCGGSTIGVQVLKRIWFRPRYFALLDNPELTFRPWYEFGKDAITPFMNLYESNHDLFRSFPSAHAASVACLFVWAIIPVYTHKGSVIFAMLVAYAGSLVTMFSRMVVGAHFLSDVSGGFLLTFVLFCLCCWCFGLTAHDDSMYEYDDEEDIDERTSNRKDKSKDRESRSSRSRKDTATTKKSASKEDRTLNLFDEDDDFYDSLPEHAEDDDDVKTAPLISHESDQDADADSEDALPKRSAAPSRVARRHAADLDSDAAPLPSDDVDVDEDSISAVLYEEPAPKKRPRWTEEDEDTVLLAEEKPKPLKRSRKNRRQQTAADLFDDSIFE